MALSTDVEVRGSDGVWRTLSVAVVLGKKTGDDLRCVDCKGPVRVHNAAVDGTQAAHVEHMKRWAGCPRSDGYDGMGLRPNPVQVR